MTADQLVADYLRTTGKASITLAELWQLAERLRELRATLTDAEVDVLLFGEKRG